MAGFGIAQSILGHTFLNPEVIQEDIRGLKQHCIGVSPITGLVAYRPTSFLRKRRPFQNFLLVSWILALGFGGFSSDAQGRLVACSVSQNARHCLLQLFYDDGFPGCPSSGLLQVPWSFAPAVHLGCILGWPAANPRNASRPAGSSFRLP